MKYFAVFANRLARASPRLAMPVLGVALLILSACAPSLSPREPEVPASQSESLSAATIFTHSPIRLSLERLTYLAQKAAPGAESFLVPPAKQGETPFLVAFGETELRIICGYEGDFSSYLELALRPAAKASAGNQKLKGELALLAGGFKDVLWLQVVPFEDKEGRTRALIKSLAEELGGTIYSQGSLFLSSGKPLWSGTKARQF